MSALAVDIDQFLTEAKAKLLQAQVRSDWPMAKAVNRAIDNAQYKANDYRRAARCEVLVCHYVKQLGVHINHVMRIDELKVDDSADLR
jgi:hypothetical protein